MYNAKCLVILFLGAMDLIYILIVKKKLRFANNWQHIRSYNLMLFEFKIYISKIQGKQRNVGCKQLKLTN